MSAIHTGVCLQNQPACMFGRIPSARSCVGLPFPSRGVASGATGRAAYVRHRTSFAKIDRNRNSWNHVRRKSRPHLITIPKMVDTRTKNTSVGAGGGRATKEDGEGADGLVVAVSTFRCLLPRAQVLCRRLHDCLLHFLTEDTAEVLLYFLLARSLVRSTISSNTFLTSCFKACAASVAPPNL